MTFLGGRENRALFWMVSLGQLVEYKFSENQIAKYRLIEPSIVKLTERRC